jgi:PadR family transcriptional regulator PadR
MHRRKSDFPPGTLEMLVLTTLARRGALNVEEGSLYPALQRLLRKGWVTAQWVENTTKRRARFYELTAEGREQLASEISEFDRVVQAIVRVIQPA